MASSRVPSSLRQTVASRARGHCEYFRAPDSFASDLFESEHILPRSLDGPTELDNLAWACGGCNLFKSNKTAAIDPDSGRVARFFHPRSDAWDEHFEWSDDFTKIIGKTAAARATVAALRMNRPSLINLRMALLAIGKHPPDL